MQLGQWLDTLSVHRVCAHQYYGETPTSFLLTLLGSSHRHRSVPNGLEIVSDCGSLSASALLSNHPVCIARLQGLGETALQQTGIDDCDVTACAVPRPCANLRPVVCVVAAPAGPHE
jgi:hypothetical protein